MKRMNRRLLIFPQLAIWFLTWSAIGLFHNGALAGTDGSVSGVIEDSDGVAVGNASVQILSTVGVSLGRATSSPTGDFRVYPLRVGRYLLKVEVPGFKPYMADVYVASGSDSRARVQLEVEKERERGGEREIVVEVKARRRLIPSSEAGSRSDVTKEQIAELPQGSEISLPKLLTTTTPGVVQGGAFNQMFFRGNHANIQYQIDGVQLPDSPSGTFGEAFSPRNIDHMEVITGGIPAEYGQRLAAVVNIVTKSGPENPGGEVELNYGSYATMSPHLLYGGSNETGAVHYFVSANYRRTDRGLDTPQPKDETNQGEGGSESVHNRAQGNAEFAKIDWLVNNRDKLGVVLFYARNRFEIPNYPDSFKSTDAFFQNGFVDRFGNGGDSSSPTFIYTPSFTNDYQEETNAFAQVIWKHAISDTSFLQIAPYYKYALIHFQNDPVNDLFTHSDGAASFYENRNIGNYGVKADYSLRLGESHLVKAGTQAQVSQSTGSASVQTGTMAEASSDSGSQTGHFESVYAQDEYSLTKDLILKAGLRADLVQFSFAKANSSDGLLQPRVGLNYLFTETTTLHIFYGKLFQPAPVEDLRSTFINTGASSCQAGKSALCPYDIKAEKSDYYEVGVGQQVFGRHVAGLNLYYKDSRNMLDDTQLFNTAIAQPYNFQRGYAYGLELSLKGEITSHWMDYLSYSYSLAKGYGISGGIFAFPAGKQPEDAWRTLDHVQPHTANAGVTYHDDRFWWTGQALYGSGLRTGSDNNASLPSHLTFDTTVGYELRGDSWLTRAKVSADVLNVTDNVYPITVYNGFNGSHYAAGREFFVRLTKEL